MRQWVSIRGPGGLRFGQSIGPEDFGPPKLPSWRRYELRKQLQTAATAKGKTMTIADCDYIIDRTLQIARPPRSFFVAAKNTAISSRLIVASAIYLHRN
jgi:hypothetical protein